MSSRFLPSLAVATLVASGITILNAQTLEQSAPDARRLYADDPLRRDDDMRDIPPPAEHDLSKSYEFVANTFGDTARSFGPALNVNTLGEVPDSSWFTNRLGQHDMTIEEILRGPDQFDGPAAGQWQVTGRPDSGITPKFTIRDARGDTYLIKLDPPSNPELPSSVEIISTKIFHAIGYHVPEDYIVHFDLSRLTVAPGAMIRTIRETVFRSSKTTWSDGCDECPSGPTGPSGRSRAGTCPGKSSASTCIRDDDPTIQTTSSRTNGDANCAACAYSPRG
jgi:hypothetical protein